MYTPKHILIAGSGLIGLHLAELLLLKGYNVAVLSRTKKNMAGVKTFNWDTDSGSIDTCAIKDADAIINLAGEGIADKRWTAKRKQQLLNSRIKSTALLYQTLKKTSHNVHTFINASAIGIYKPGNELLFESSTHGNDFLASICNQWETEALKMQSINIRTVIFRIGLVMSKKGGMLKEMLLPGKFFIAPVLGNGSQWQSWIHINDLCSMIVFALENKNICGIYNAVAPQPVSNINLVRAIQSAVKNITFKIPVPAFALKMVLGKRTQMLLASHKVSCKKITDEGFKFQFQNSSDAIFDCITQNN